MQDDQKPRETAASMKRFSRTWLDAVLATSFATICVLVTACSGGSSSPSSAVPHTAATIAVAATPTALVSAAPATQADIECSDCWPTYAHDYQRLGFQPSKTGIDETNVANLVPRWARPLNEQIVVSPVIDDGMVLIGTGAGNIYALSETTGSILWKHSLGGPILVTPTIDRGVVYVGTHHAPSSFFALDLKTGNVLWQTSITGVFRGPAAVAHGVVYVGEAGGDPPTCDAGGLHAYQAATGAEIFFWQTDPTPHDGGAVWTPVTVDDGNILFGTGNTCSNGVPNGNSLMRLTNLGQQEWEIPSGTVTETDDDWGGGIAATGGRYYAANKNGYFYAIDPSTGAIVWKQMLSPFDGQGSIGTPTTDGSVIIIPSGNLLDGHVASPPTANFSAFTTGGTKLWSVTFDDLQRNYAPIAGSIAYLGTDAKITAVDIHSGTTLWTYASSGGVEFIGPPAITSAGLVTADADGAVIDFLPASTASAARSRIAVRRGPLYEPYGSITRDGVKGFDHIRF